MQKLAKAAGVSPATIYIYFKNRDDLIVSLFREVQPKMAELTLDGLRPRDVVRRGAAPAVDQPRALLPGQPEADALHGADPLLAVLRA